MQVLVHLSQPTTARQLSYQHEVTLEQSCQHLQVLSKQGLLTCINPDARKSRLYWLTPSGEEIQHQLRKVRKLQPLQHTVPEIDWALYAWTCYSQRSAVIKAMEGALQPSAIKRKARDQNQELRMSANNARDIVKLFLAKRIAETVVQRGRKHLRYELTPLGKTLQHLLRQAQTKIQHQIR